MNKKTTTTTSVRFVKIDAQQHGQRVDNFLIKTLKSLPRSRIYRIIRKGEVRVNKKRIKPEYKLMTGDIIRIPPILQEPDDESPVCIGDDLLKRMESSVLYENQHIIVVDKPSGLAVHSGSGLRYGVIDVIRRLRPDHQIELVHRLDRDTSGCLLLAKHRNSLLDMQRLLQSGEIRKYYLAIVKGHWNPAITDISLALKRVTMPNGEKKVFVDESGQEAHTRIRRVQHYSLHEVRFSCLEVQLLTGRTHQIRVHCQSQQHEIAGDKKYGDRIFNQQMKKLGSKRLLLHAHKLEFPPTAHTKAVTLLSQRPKEFGELTRDEH